MGLGVAASACPGFAAETVRERGANHSTVPGDSRQNPILRAISSWPANQTGPNTFLFAVNSRQLYSNVDAQMASVSSTGFNSLYMLYNPYRSEDGRPTPWQEDLPPNHPDFPAVARLTDADRASEAETFQRVLAACQWHRLKILFNVGCWSPQTWFRDHPDAVSRLPDGSPQFDAIFLNQHKPVYTPCFRSERFRAYAENVVRGWLRQYHGQKEFEAVLCRVSLPDRFEIRLDDRGFPLFFLHQDTIDRNWCHCATCRAAFQKRLQERYGSIEAANCELGASFSAFSEVTIPRSPNHAAGRDGSQGIDLLDDPKKNRLWYEAARFWSESIAGWRARIVKAVRKFYPDAEVMMISKYPKGSFLTDYPLIDRGGKVFLMDSYPMEGDRNWEFLRWLCDLEVYQSAAQQQGQAIVAHLQAFDNTSWAGRPCRAPWPAEFCQQHVAMIARGIGAPMSFGFNHVVQLCPTGSQQGLLPEDAVIKIVRQQHAVAERLERVFQGTVPYRGGVIVRYNPQETCNPQGAAAVYARYKQWKDRSTPVSLVWDEQRKDETIPDRFEFFLEGPDTAETDLAIRCTDSWYLATLINLRHVPRDLRLRVRLKDKDMDRYEVSRVDESTPVVVEHSAGNLCCGIRLPALGYAVLRLDKRQGVPR